MTPGLPRTIVEALEARAESAPAEPAIWLESLDAPTETITCAGLRDGALGAARRLAGSGVGAGDAVVFLLPTGRDLVETFYGALAAGAVAVPLYPPAGARQLQASLANVRRVIGLTRPAKLVTLEPLAALLRDQPGIGDATDVVTAAELGAAEPAEPERRPRPDDLALVQFSSGSTGVPRGVALTHHNIVFNVRAFQAVVGMGPPDVAANWLPLYHDMGLIGTLIGTLVIQIPLALFSPLDFLRSPALWLQTMSRYGANMSVAPQFAYNLCVRKVRDEDLDGVDLSHVRLLLNGAEPTDVSECRRFEERFASVGLRRGVVTPCYGLAEHALAVSMAAPRVEIPVRRVGDVAAGSTGPPLRGTEIRILDPAPQQDATQQGARPLVAQQVAWPPVALADETIGEIALRSESVCAGYVTEGGVERAVDADGWLRTGDLGFLSGGELYVVDRLKDVVIVQGRNLYPHDVEKEVARVPGVRRGRVAVFGVRSAEHGTEELVVAPEVVLEEGDDPVRCAAAVRRRVVEGFGVTPHDVVLLPRGRIELTSSGKLRRHRIREEYEAGTIGDAIYSLRASAARQRSALAEVGS
ncbi:MAG TPA: AMP-binding protein [Thermoleophilaceae bacterium]|nr:AMP-binding protein [Thermoleophilaceae bacterium]